MSGWISYSGLVYLHGWAQTHLTRVQISSMDQSVLENNVLSQRKGVGSKTKDRGLASNLTLLHLPVWSQEKSLRLPEPPICQRYLG